MRTKSFGENIEINHAECDEIRKLNDFDLEMLLSEINDHGWVVARQTLSAMVEALTKSK
jgi:hypothetical protein